MGLGKSSIQPVSIKISTFSSFATLAGWTRVVEYSECAIAAHRKNYVFDYVSL
jgi:hypothetical protein